MKRQLHLYWFSGSGNTLLVAEAFAERLRQLEWDVELRPLERSDPTKIDPVAVLGLAFPTHCFTIPEIVLSFVRSLPKVDGAEAMMLGTQGAFSGGIVGPMKRELTAKGFRCTATRIISMPDNFFPFSNDNANRRKIERGLSKAERYAEDFAAGKVHWARWAVISDLYAAFFRGFFATRFWTRNYYSTVHVQPEQCKRCDACSLLCPVDAMERKPGGLPHPKRKCTNCLRCVAVCPNDAMRHMIGFRPYRSEEVAVLQSRFIFD